MTLIAAAKQYKTLYIIADGREIRKSSATEWSSIENKIKIFKVKINGSTIPVSISGNTGLHHNSSGKEIYNIGLILNKLKYENFHVEIDIINKILREVSTLTHGLNINDGGANYPLRLTFFNIQNFPFFKEYDLFFKDQNFKIKTELEVYNDNRCNLEASSSQILYYLSRNQGFIDFFERLNHKDDLNSLFDINYQQKILSFTNLISEFNKISIQNYARYNGVISENNDIGPAFLIILQKEKINPWLFILPLNRIKLILLKILGYK